MVWISLVKVLLFIFGLLYMLSAHFKKDTDSALEELWTSRIVLLILIVFSISLLWSDVDRGIALPALVKHGKLLEILLLVSLIRTAREARIGMSAFAAGQFFLLLGSWLLASGVPIPWATAKGIGSEYVVFSSYLDQSIIFATTAAVFWHLRATKLWPRWLGGLLAGAALLNVLLMLNGRTGYAIAAILLTLAIMWAMPRRLRFATLIATPIIVLFTLYLGSSQVHGRLLKIIHEVQSYVIEGENGTPSGGEKDSSGWRLNAWHRSVQAIEENPWLGHGVGSWTTTVKRLEGSSAANTFGAARTSNPHQEYLLWGVELGIGGALLLLALMICIIRDAQRFNNSTKRTVLSVVMAMVIACMFNSALYDALIGDFFCIALGLLMALGLRARPGVPDQEISAPELLRLKVAT